MDKLGGAEPYDTLNNWAAKTVGTYPVTSLLIIVVFALIILWKWNCKESFMPTVTAYSQERDDTGATSWGKFDPNSIPVSQVGPEILATYGQVYEGATGAPDDWTKTPQTRVDYGASQIAAYGNDCSGVTLHSYDPYAWMLNDLQKTGGPGVVPPMPVTGAGGPGGSPIPVTGNTGTTVTEGLRVTYPSGRSKEYIRINPKREHMAAGSYVRAMNGY
jgi:hypothetical protein